MSYYSNLTFIAFIVALALMIYVVRFALASKKQFAPGNHINKEDILYSGRANSLYGASKTMSDGGYLVLTNKQLWFFPHGFNISASARAIPRSQIAEAFPRRTGGIFPNGLGVRLKDDSEQYFVVKKRMQWVDQLNTE